MYFFLVKFPSNIMDHSTMFNREDLAGEVSPTFSSSERSDILWRLFGSDRIGRLNLKLHSLLKVSLVHHQVFS